MTDDRWFAPGHRMPPRVPWPGEVLCTFTRQSDGAPMACVVRFHGESFGCEAQFLERGELFYSHGAFTTRAAAIAWAEQERHDVEKGGGA